MVMWKPVMVKESISVIRFVGNNILVPYSRNRFGQHKKSEPSGEVIRGLSFCAILVPRGRASFGQHRESRPLGRSDFPSMPTVIVSYSKPIRLSDLTLSMRRMTGSP